MIISTPPPPPVNPFKRSHSTSPVTPTSNTLNTVTRTRHDSPSQVDIEPESAIGILFPSDQLSATSIQAATEMESPTAVVQDGGDMNSVIGLIPRQEDAADQTRRLFSLSVQEAESLGRLCSQHSHSSYNASKRMVMVLPPLQLHPTHPTSPLTNSATPSSHQHINRPVPVQRSQSTPIASSSQQNRPEIASSSSRNANSNGNGAGGLASTGWSLLKNATSGWVDNTFPSRKSSPAPLATISALPALVTASEATAAVSTPPAKQTSILNTTLLTPSLLTFSLDAHPSLPTPEYTPAHSPSATQIQSVPIERSGSIIDDVPRMNGNNVNGNGITPELLPGMKMMNGIAVKTSISHPMNVSHLIPPGILTMVSAHIYACTSESTPSPTSPPLSATPFLVRQAPGIDLFELTSMPYPSSPSTSQTTESVDAPARSLVGNFLLSSCPGKKVRLNATNGPGGGLLKGGRSAICRDLETDLRKVMEEGARVVICCLDDQELAYLGAPWEEYAEISTKLALPVIRIPMVEGYAPFSPASLDAHLSSIILEQSLQGSSVLSQCRGGQGRAGTVACCWMIKMGLVGDGRPVDEKHHQLDDAMRVVERVIEVIRRRRGLKAIETPQHVHFILEYVKYLRQHAHVRRASDLRSSH